MILAARQPDPARSYTNSGEASPGGLGGKTGFLIDRLDERVAMCASPGLGSTSAQASPEPMVNI